MVSILLVEDEQANYKLLKSSFQIQQQVKIELDYAPLVQVAKDHFETVFGVDHRSTALVYSVVAKCHFKLGDNEQAESYFLRWKKSWEDFFTPGHQYLAEVYYELGSFYAASDRLEEGIALLEESKDIFVEKLGNQNPLVPRGYIALGDAYLEKGDVIKSRANYRFAILASEGSNEITSCNNPSFLLDSYLGIGSGYLTKFRTSQKAINLNTAEDLALLNFYAGTG